MTKCCAENYDSHFEATSLGELFKSVREQRGITLKEIASKTKIHVGILMHLENNNFAELPSKTYLKGFVKSMSIFLGINPKKAIDLLEAAYYQIGQEKASQIPPITPRADYFIISKISDFKIPKRVPEISRRKVSGLILLLLGSVLVDFGYNYISYKVNSHSTATSMNSLAEAPTKELVPQKISEPVANMTLATEVTQQKITEPVASIAPATGPASSVPADVIQSKTVDPVTSYPIAISLKFPKTLEAVDSKGNIVPTNRY
jgi:cytoskeleton protein RodZ